MKKIYELEDLDCAVCADKMEMVASKIEGVKSCTISFMSQKMTIEFIDGVDEKEVMNKVANVCKKIEPDCVIKR